MAVISFGDTSKQVWGGSGWAVRQVLKDVRPYAEGNDRFLAALANAELSGYLLVDDLEPDLRRVVIVAIQQMCIDIISGARPSTIKESLPGDRAAHDLYSELIDDLLSLANAAADLIPN